MNTAPTHTLSYARCPISRPHPLQSAFDFTRHASLPTARSDRNTNTHTTIKRLDQKPVSTIHSSGDGVALVSVLMVVSTLTRDVGIDDGAGVGVEWCSAKNGCSSSAAGLGGDVGWRTAT